MNSFLHRVYDLVVSGCCCAVLMGQGCTLETPIKGAPCPCPEGYYCPVGTCWKDTDPVPSTGPERYDDVRGRDLTPFVLGEEVIRTLWFNKWTLWNEQDIPAARKVLEQGKNPGLGIRALHDSGINGQGVNIAVISQHIGLEHPEYAGRIAAYYDTGCMEPPETSSMTAPAVVSLLVGKTVGMAPMARIYFAAVPTWKSDADYYADGLLWIISENGLLPDDEKIRVVSAPSACDGFKKNQQKWTEAVALAESEGMSILDSCEERRFVVPSMTDWADPESVANVTTAFTLCDGGGDDACLMELLLVPGSLRTAAEEYLMGEFGYQYFGHPNAVMAMCYAAGVMALGWQLRPELTAEEMKQLLFDTSFNSGNGNVIYPTAFIERILSDAD